MIGQKGPPALRWRPAPVHIACDRRLRDRETELEQFTVNVWCAPQVICTAHRADETTQLGRDPRPASRLVAGGNELLIVIGRVFRGNSPKVLGIEHQQMVRALAPDRADQAFNISVLPRGTE